MNQQQQYYNKHKRNRERQLFYQSSKWSKARELALKRDNYLCVRCLKEKRIRKADVVHHIRYLADYPELATALDNLVSWCNECHTRHHKVNENKKNNIPKSIDVVISKPNPERFD